MAKRNPGPYVRAGERFGRLIALEDCSRSSFRANGKQVKFRVKVRCECGAEKSIFATSLRSGRTVSCGCFHRERLASGNGRWIVGSYLKEGQVFGRLTVLETVRGCNDKVSCRCECGGTYIATAIHVKLGHTQSCGCLRNEKAAEAKTTHGMSKHPLYNTWVNMMQRCYNSKNPGYADYGGRGIAVCDRWTGTDGLKNFIEDMEPRPEGMSLDRIDVNGDYGPLNCRWATPREQMHNQRPRARNADLDKALREIERLKGMLEELGVAC